MKTKFPKKEKKKRKYTKPKFEYGNPRGMNGTYIKNNGKRVIL